MASCSESNNAVTPEISSLYGKYQVKNVVRYRGGLTTEDQAVARIGSCITIEKSLFKSQDLNMKNPVYKIDTYVVKSEEGEVIPKSTRDFLSIYNGYRTDRKKVVSLNVFSPDNSKDFEDSFEIIDGEEILNLFDGFFYFFEKGCGNTE